MRINWVSPLPPQKSGIATYSVQVLPELRKLADVRICANHKVGELSSIPVAQLDAVRWTELNDSDITIYNIGNNSTYHADIWEKSRRCPGLVILHDQLLQHLFAGYLLSQLHDPQAYIGYMRQYYGDAGAAQAGLYMGGECDTEYMAEHYPLTQLAVEHALGVIVHTRECFELVSATNLCPVALIPLAHQPAEQQEIGAWRHIRNAAAGGPRRLAMFGFLGPNRRIDSVLAALAEKQNRQEWRLDIYGNVWDLDHVRAKIVEHGLGELVHIHGYVNELDEKLATADLVVNLRLPTMGEASATQLRIWDHALPSLVTQTGWYATLHGDTVAHVRPDQEIADISTYLQSYVQNPEPFVEMGRRGRQQLLREHSAEKYAQSVIEVAREAIRFKPTAASLVLSERVADEISIWLSLTNRHRMVDRITPHLLSFTRERQSS